MTTLYTYRNDWEPGVGFVDPTFGDLGSPTIVSSFTPPTVEDEGPLTADRHPGDRLMKFYRPRPRGVDVWLLTSQTNFPLWDVSENQPFATGGGTIDVETYNRGNTEYGLPVTWKVFKGGVGNAVNAIEAASLAAAGYLTNIITPPPPAQGAWLTWDQAGATWDASGLIWG